MVLNHSQTLVSGVGTWEVWKKGWKHRGWRPSSGEWNLVKTGQILVKPWSYLSQTSQTYYFMVLNHSQTLVSGVGTWEVWKKGWKHRGWRPSSGEWNLVKTGQILVKTWSNLSQTSQTYYFMVTQHSQVLISGVGTWEVWKKGWKHRGWRPPSAEWNLVKTCQILVKSWSYLTVKPVKHIILWLHNTPKLRFQGLAPGKCAKRGESTVGDAHRGPSGIWSKHARFWSNLGQIYSQTSQTYYFMVTQHSQNLDFRGWHLGSVQKGVKAPWVTPTEGRVESGRNRPNSGQTLVISKSN